MKSFIFFALPLVFALLASVSSAQTLHQVMLEPDMLEIVNIRVGQGDATLILGPQDGNGNRVKVLFDAADIPERDGGFILKAVLNKWDVDELDFFILSHDDADHLGGIAFGGAHHGDSFILGRDDAPGEVDVDDDGNGVTDWVDPGEFFHPDPDELGFHDDLIVKNFIDHGTDLFRLDESQAIRKYIGFADNMGDREKISTQEEIDNFEIDLGGGAVMKCYASNGFIRGGNGNRVSFVNTPNERSMSFLITHGNFDYLISGDLIGQRSGGENAKVEIALANKLEEDEVKVEVLHVNHHGASNGSAPAFLEKIKPRVAVISLGNRNTHKHPTKKTLKALVNAGVDRIIQTSWGSTVGTIPLDVRDHQAIYQSDIIIRSDGSSYKISTDRVFQSKSDTE